MNINEHKVQTALHLQGEEINVMHTCVCANVSSEQPRSGEGLAAGGAHTGQSV